MNSIAIWFEKKNSVADSIVPELDLHINHWKLKFNKNSVNRAFRTLITKTLGQISDYLVLHNSDYFMDLGLMIRNGEAVERICMYFPGKFTDKTKLIEDIGGKLMDKRVLTAVFNEAYDFKTQPFGKFFSVFQNDTPKFNIYMLDVENDIKIENKFNGTIVKFNYKIFNGSSTTYYRFRIKEQFVKELSYVYKPSNSFLESAYSSIEIVDFRVNDTRNLDVSLIEEMNNNGKFNIGLVHYFVMRNVKDEYIVSNQILNSVRQLEDNTWTSYVGDTDYFYDKTFAYHLKKKKEGEIYIDEFSGVLKFKFEDTKLVIYFIYLLLFALLTEIIGSSFYDHCKVYIDNFYDAVKHLFKK